MTVTKELTKEQAKSNHQRAMREVAALSIQHGLRFLDPNDPVRKVIEKDIEVVRSHNADAILARYKAAQKRQITYTVAGLLIQGSQALLYLAKHRGYPSDGLRQMVDYFPTEAGYLFSAATRNVETIGREQRIECEWQETNIQPLVEKLFKNWGQPLEVPTIEIPGMPNPGENTKEVAAD